MGRASHTYTLVYSLSLHLVMMVCSAAIEFNLATNCSCPLPQQISRNCAQCELTLDGWAIHCRKSGISNLPDFATCQGFRSRILHNLELEYNSLLYLNSSIFRSLSKVVQVGLSHNHLVSTEFLTAPQLRGVEYLTLDYNPLADIDPQHFSDLQSLESLDMSSAGLMSTEFLAINMGALMWLFLSDNPGIVSVHPLTLTMKPSLTDIVMDGCSIADLTFLESSDLAGLETIDLRRNRIEFLHTDTFRFLSNLRTIRLRYNRVQFVSPELLLSLPKLTTFQVTDNPINCECYNTTTDLAGNQPTLLKSIIGSCSSHNDTEPRCSEPRPTSAFPTPTLGMESITIGSSNITTTARPVIGRGAGGKGQSLNGAVIGIGVSAVVLAIVVATVISVCARRIRKKVKEETELDHCETDGEIYETIDEDKQTDRVPKSLNVAEPEEVCYVEGSGNSEGDNTTAEVCSDDAENYFTDQYVMRVY